MLERQRCSGWKNSRLAGPAPAEDDHQFAADELARQRRRLKKKEARLETEADRVELRRTRTKVQLGAGWPAISGLSGDASADSTATEMTMASIKHWWPSAMSWPSGLPSFAAARGLAGRWSPHAAEIEELRSRLERAFYDVRD